MSDNRPAIVLVAAVARNGVIGAAGTIPWRLSTDLRRFRRLTIGKPVIMGRATFESLGKPLADRDNIVVTSRAINEPGVTAVRTVADALDVARRSADRLDTDEIVIGGGGQLYAVTIGDADRLYITHVDAEPDGDAFFPDIDPAIWRPAATELVPAGERDNFDSAFVTYLRRTVDVPEATAHLCGGSEGTRLSRARCGESRAHAARPGAVPAFAMPGSVAL